MKLGNKIPSWLYQANRINTQDAAGPAALTTRLSVASGQVARIVSGRFAGCASGGATFNGFKYDEDGALACNIIKIAAGASRYASLPSPGDSATSHGSIAGTKDMIIAPGEYLVFESSISLATETLQVAIALLLYHKSDIPTWDTTGSGGTPNLAASTISVANTLHWAGLVDHI